MTPLDQVGFKVCLLLLWNNYGESKSEQVCRERLRVKTAGLVGRELKPDSLGRFVTIELLFAPEEMDDSNDRDISQ